MRVWMSDGDDSGSIHCLGNGLICAYEQGPNIVQLFGPPYSSPSFLTLSVGGDSSVRAESTREPGSDIWRHTLSAGGETLARFIDFIPPEVPCLIRRMTQISGLTLTLRFGQGVTVVENPSGFGDAGGALLAFIEAGTGIYGRYPTLTRQYAQILFTAPVSCRRSAPGEYTLTFSRGCCDILLATGTGYPEAILAAEAMLRADPDALLGNTRNQWREFTGSGKDFSALIPGKFPYRERLLELIDSVSVLIRTQQSREGAVLAGYNYHLGYVRDQYGVSRCLLALGYYEQARAILSFYWDVWSRYGRLQNAQGIGTEAFHVHENDEVEITGYLILQAFDYLGETGDDAFVERILPMLLWAFEAQKKNLIRGMLPFNGDETYIAGGLLPRDCINDGSAEATLLFLTGGRRLLHWAAEHGTWSDEERTANHRVLGDTRARFEGNFIRDGQLITNNPARLDGREPPRFRHGVCQRCGAFDWTERTPGGLYACPLCRQQPCGKSADRIHILKSVTLMPMYIGSGVLPAGLMEGFVTGIVEEYQKTGRLPSSPELDGTVGYDYGLLLYSLIKIRHPAAEDIAADMLSVVDDTDAWVEYYRSGQPTGTRCRPWESGINLHALVEYALHWQQDPPASPTQERQAE